MEIFTEKLDDLPLINGLLDKLDIVNQIDKIYPRPKNWKGLSIGSVVHVWLIYLLSSCDHRLSYVEDWVCDHFVVLSTITNWELRREDFCDDKLGLILEYLSSGSSWNNFLSNFAKKEIQVYDLDTDIFRIDATIGKSFKKVIEGGLFQMGNSKHFRSDLAQFKMMLATLDPIGLPVASLIVSGEKADDPLYIPVIKQAMENTKTENKLFVGDSKMSSLKIRSFIAGLQHFYLSPLTAVQIPTKKLMAYLQEFEQTKKDFEFVYKGEQKIAKGFELEVVVSGEFEGKPISWKERRLCVRSYMYANSKIKSLIKRVEKAMRSLEELNIRKQGKKIYSSEEQLNTICKNILKKNKVADIVKYNIKTQTKKRYIRAYKNKPAREEVNTTFTVDATINQSALQQSKNEAGWRVYATNSPNKKFTLSSCVKIYRKEYIIEHCFKHLKNKPLHLLPLYLHKDERIKGLINLLTLALSGIRIIEYNIHSGLQKSKKELSGLYPGNPRRKTKTPSVQLILKNYNEIYHTTITQSEQKEDKVLESTNGSQPQKIEQKNKVTKKLEKVFTDEDNTEQIVIQTVNSNIPTKNVLYEPEKKESNNISQVSVTALTMLQVIILQLLGLSPTIYTDLENKCPVPYSIIERKNEYNKRRKKKLLNWENSKSELSKYFDSS